MDILKNERGMALVTTFLFLVMMGALLSAAFAPVLLEFQLAENSRRSGHAFGVAEFGLGEAVGNWHSEWNALDVLDSTTFSGSVPSGGGTYSGTVHRLSDDVFLVDVIGKDRANQARQRITQFAKFEYLEIDIQGALTTQGPTKIGGNARIDGTDSPPSGWSCEAPQSPLPGLRVSDPNDLEVSGPRCEIGLCLSGDPPVEADPSVADSTFFQYGDADWADLVAMATVVIPNGTWKIEPTLALDGGCDDTKITNWGDPLTLNSPCFSRFPIVYAPGNLTINGDLGQGVLLVEGDLSVQGGFQFYGILIVRGKLKTAGTGGHFNGSVMAANVDLDDNTVLGDAVIQYSSCAVLRGLRAASPAAPLRSRGWLRAF